MQGRDSRSGPAATLLGSRLAERLEPTDPSAVETAITDKRTRSVRISIPVLQRVLHRHHARRCLHASAGPSFICQARHAP